MDIKRKKELLSLADSISKDINKQGCGNYVPKIINSINIAKKRNDKSLIHMILNKMKKSQFGGRRQENGFDSFVDEIFKNPHYRINSLSFEELDFLFSWIRRIVKDENSSSSNKKNFNKNPYQNNMKNSNHSNNINRKEKIYRKYSSNSNKRKKQGFEDNNDSGLNDSLFAALSKYKFE